VNEETDNSENAFKVIAQLMRNLQCCRGFFLCDKIWWCNAMQCMVDLKEVRGFIWGDREWMVATILQKRYWMSYHNAMYHLFITENKKNYFIKTKKSKGRFFFSL